MVIFACPQKYKNRANVIQSHLFSASNFYKVLKNRWNYEELYFLAFFLSFAIFYQYLGYTVWE